MDSCAGNPINIGTGNKYQLETDYQGAGDFPLSFERTYNSDVSTLSERLGYSSGWRHSYERSIIGTGNSSLVVAYRPDGRAYTFTLVGGHWLPVADVNLQLNRSASPDVWQLTTEDDSIETYTADGKLQSIKSRGGATHTLSYTNGVLTTITHSSGRSLTLSYDGASRLSSLQDPAGNLYRYGYNAATGDLETVTYPDSTPAVLTDNPVKTYVYNEAANTAGANLPHALTGIVDENNQRFASFQYDSQRRAITTQHAGGAEYVGVSYGTDSNVVTDALGTPRTHRFQIVQGVVKSAGSDQPAGASCSAAASNVGYDANGNIASRTDFNGNLSCYAYDLTRNLETVRLEGLTPGASCPADLAAYAPAANGSVRKITTQWHANYRLPSQVDQASQRQSFGYDSAGNLLQKTVTDTATQQSRSWGYTYNSLGQVLTEDGPRTDVTDITTYAYYSDSTATHKPGDLWTITNAQGHVTTCTVVMVQDLTVSAFFNPLPLTLSIAKTGSGDGTITSSPAGINCGTTCSASFGNNPATVITLTATPATGSTFQGWLGACTGLATTVTIPDEAGNLKLRTDARGKTANYSYDSLNRISQIAYEDQTVTYTWDNCANGIGRLCSVANNNSSTSYGYDSHGRLTNKTQTAGATPLTVGHAYNTAGQRIGSLSPSGQTIEYQWTGGRITANQHHDYDELDRLTGSQRGDAGQSRIDYSYDLGGNRTGKVLDTTVYNYNTSANSNQLQSQSGAQTVSYSYDPAGNLIGDGTRSYNYNAAGQRIAVTGQAIGYGYDALGQRVAKTVAGNTTQYVYDEQGRLTGEYAATGQLIQEIVWLDNLPVAVLKPTVPAGATTDIYYLHADPLGTPRKITRPLDNKVVWTWESEAFGNSLPDQNPSGLGSFTFNLRFPGQYYDAETGLHYNMARDYDPKTGRYIESDPIGLGGGINTYTYVENNPLSYIDPTGLEAIAEMQKLNWGIDNNAGNEDPCGCFASALGFDTAVGAGMVASGQPILNKPFNTINATPGTSPASQYLSKALPQRLPFRVLTPTLEHPFATSNVLGRILGRWVPYVGLGILGKDLVGYADCVKKCQDQGICKK